MTLGVSLVGWRSPNAPHGQQQRGHTGRTSKRSRDVVLGRVTLEVHSDENLGLRWPRFCPRRGRWSRLW